MPRAVSEITEGVVFARSSEDGQIADSQPRVFRVVLNEPNEQFDVQAACGVFIGDELSPGKKLYCTSFDARFEGTSRLIVLCTFQFRTTPSAQSSSGGQDPKSQPPDIRPANWTTSTSLVESPRSVWARRAGAGGNAAWGADEPAVNPAGDVYDGVTALEPIVTISITQHDVTDPTKHNLYAGHVNEEQIVLGSLSMGPGTVLFRGVSSTPTIESWGGQLFRGWTSTYEFAFKRNRVKIHTADEVLGSVVEGDEEVDIGWDLAVPLSGFNVKAFDPSTADNDEDVYSQPLMHGDEGTQFDGRIREPLALPLGVTEGDRVRAMVKVFSYKNRGASQSPSASPVALKKNGRPLKTHNAAGELINPPLVYAYRVQPKINFTQTLALRLG